MEGHAFAKFSTGLLKNPVPAQANTTWSVDSSKSYSAGHSKSEPVHHNEDPLYVHQPEPPNFQRLSDSQQIKLQSLTVDRGTLTADFYKKLRELQKEHQKTLKLVNQLQLNDSHQKRRCHMNDFQEENGKYNSAGFYKTSEYHYVESSDDEALPIPGFSSRKVEFKHQERGFDDDVQENTNSDSEDSCVDSSCGIIEHMWDNFSVDSYSDAQRASIRKRANFRPKSAPPKRKEWSPVITIPKPFRMTLREEKKKEKSHSKSSHEINCRQKQKEEEEGMELKKRVSAREPPAHIYLPLYEEMKERREQRSRFNRENSIATLVALQKPFSFAERDDRKRTALTHRRDKEKARELRDIKRMAQFEANGVPYSVHDPSVSDRMTENELYRKIKNKMRAEDLMHSSALPPRMHVHEMMAQDKRKAWMKEVEKESAFPFQPRTTDVPDFDALHRREQLDALQRKTEGMTTVVEPFTFHTSKRSEKRHKLWESMEDAEKSFETEVRSRPNSGRRSSFSDNIPTRMTDSARLRIENMRRSLQEAERIIEQAKEDEFERKERRKKLAQRVVQKSADYEISASTNRQTSKEEKLRVYKKQMRERDHEYKKFLAEVKGRVDERPLLFEQHAEKVAKAQAEKRYREILETSGLSDDFVDSKGRLSVESDHSAVISPRGVGKMNQDFRSDLLSDDSESELRSCALQSSSKRDILSSTAIVKTAKKDEHEEDSDSSSSLEAAENSKEKQRERETVFA